MCFGKPKVPKVRSAPQAAPPPPAAPNTPPQPNEEEILAQQDEFRRRLRGRRGRSSTILTGPQGLGAPGPSVGKTLLGQ